MTQTKNLETFLYENKPIFDLLIEYGIHYRYHVSELINKLNVNIDNVERLYRLQRSWFFEKPKAGTQPPQWDLLKQKYIESKLKLIEDYVPIMMEATFFFTEEMPEIPDDYLPIKAIWSDIMQSKNSISLKTKKVEIADRRHDNDINGFVYDVGSCGFSQRHISSERSYRFKSKLLVPMLRNWYESRKPFHDYLKIDISWYESVRI